MNLQKIGLTTLLTLLALIAVTPKSIKLPLSLGTLEVLAQTQGVKKAEAEQLLKECNKQFRERQFETGLQTCQKALNIFREIKDRKGEGIVLKHLGSIYIYLREYDKAFKYLEESLVLARSLNDRVAEGVALGTLGAAYHQMANYTKAIQYLTQWLEIARSTNNRNSEVSALTLLGLSYYALDEYAKAIEYSKLALSIPTEKRDPIFDVLLLGTLGGAYFSFGEYGESIEYHSRSLQLARSIQYIGGSATALGSLGSVYYSIGDADKAIKLYQQSLYLAQKIKDDEGQIVAQINLGNTYHSLDDYGKATNYYQSSLKLSRQIQDRRHEAQILGGLGQVYISLGDYQKAIQYLKQELEIAKQINDRSAEGKTLANLALTYGYLNEYTKEIQYYQQSLVLARSLKDREWSASVLNNIGVSLYKQGKLKEAEDTLFDAIKVKEEIRALAGKNDTNKVSIFERQSTTYSILQQVLVASNKKDSALEISERGRTRAFVELLYSKISNQKTPTNTVTSPTIKEIQKIAKDQNATLVEYSVTYDEFKVEGRIKRKESELYIWIVRPTGEIAFERVDLKPLWQKENTSINNLVNTGRESIGVRSGRNIGALERPNTTAAQNRFKRLYNLLIEPIAKHLPTNANDRIIFIPQESLFLVPFPALQDDKGKYLIEKHTILTAPSIQVLDLTRKQRLRSRNWGTGSDSYLVVGNPTMPKVSLNPGEPKQQLSPLPGAEVEAKAIAKIFNTKPLIGNEATESRITQLMPKARIIHLATHGLFDNIRGLSSSIALAPDIPTSSLKEDTKETGDGLLTAEEILDMKLNAEMVVLSACDTGRGRITGDGVIGLSRSLISAGVPTVIVSLWAIPDAPTALLMKEFYQNLSKQPDKAAALRQAMLTTKEKYPQPQNWAAFTVIGETEFR